MSVQRNQYLGYGYMLDFNTAKQILVDAHGEEGYENISNQYHDNAFKPDIVEVHGCSMIEDGMNGKYTFFGKIYAKSTNYEVIETRVLTKPSVRDRTIVEHEFARIFGKDRDVKPELYIISHYR